MGNRARICRLIFIFGKTISFEETISYGSRKLSIAYC